MATAGVSPSVRVMVTESVAVWPAASRAVTVMTLAPGESATDATVHAAVPVATPDTPRSLAHRTSVTPKRSVAVPARGTDAFRVEYVAASVGMAMLTVGAV